MYLSMWEMVNLQVVAINVERQSIFAHMLVSDLAKNMIVFPFKLFV